MIFKKDIPNRRYSKHQITLKLEEIQKEIDEQRKGLEIERRNRRTPATEHYSINYSQVELSECSDDSSEENHSSGNTEFKSFLKDQESSLFGEEAFSQNRSIFFKKSKFSGHSSTQNGEEFKNYAKKSEVEKSHFSLFPKAYSHQSLILSSNRIKNEVQEVRPAIDFSKKNKLWEDKMRRKDKMKFKTFA